MINIYNNSDIKRLPIKSVHKTVENVFENERSNRYDVNIIYVNSDFIEEMNEKYLQHLGATDVITFELNEDNEDIMGEIYICVDVAAKQAQEYKVSLKNEINRLAAHGALHLCGYHDNTEQLRADMAALETKYMAV